MAGEPAGNGRDLPDRLIAGVKANVQTCVAVTFPQYLVLTKRVVIITIRAGVQVALAPRGPCGYNGAISVRAGTR